MIEKMNIRVYACAVHDGRVLVLHEEYAGVHLMKFPGGGLELGEGVLDCLHREFKEELNCKIEIVEHLYTQEEFLKSRFRENEQLQTIYYLVKIAEDTPPQILDPTIEKIEWISIKHFANSFELPMDKIAFERLKQKFS